MSRVVALAAGLGSAVLLSTPAGALAQTFPGPDVLRLSEGLDAARNPAISQDKRFARLAAFEGDAGGRTGIYVVERAPGYGEDGSPWAIGRTRLVSLGLNGQPADGPSTRPSLDGTSRRAPRCVAFVSAASNLVRGDTNGTADAFVHDLGTGRTRRVSVDSRGRQSRGTVTEVAVNGLCTRVAFVSDGGDLGLRRTRNRNWRSARTRATPPGRRQVYVRAIGGSTGIDRALRGLTFLASASTARQPGDGDSYDIAFTHNVTSRALTFTSRATNLAAADSDPRPDVFQRVMERRYGRKIRGRRSQYLAMTTSLVSTGRGESHSPSTNVDGTVVAYATTDPLFSRVGEPQVVQVDATGQRTLVSRTDAGAPGDGPSGAPTVSAGGSWVIFQSAASDVGTVAGRRPDANGVQDIQLFTRTTGERWVLAERGATAPARDPMTSPHGNYVVFERNGHVHLNYVGPK